MPTLCTAVNTSSPQVQSPGRMMLWVQGDGVHGAVSELPQEPGAPTLDPLPLPTMDTFLASHPHLWFTVSKEVELLSLSGAQGLQIASL